MAKFKWSKFFRDYGPWIAGGTVLVGGTLFFLSDSFAWDYMDGHDHSQGLPDKMKDPQKWQQLSDAQKKELLQQYPDAVSTAINTTPQPSVVDGGQRGADGVINSSRRQVGGHPKASSGYTDQPPMPPPVTPVLVFPVPGHAIGRRGYGRVPSLSKPGSWSWHGAVDIGAKPGTPYVAPDDGIVQSVVSGLAQDQKLTQDGRKIYCGNNISVFHGNKNPVPFDYVSVNCHLKDVYVKKGDYVKRGQTIGTIGWSGNTVPADERGSHAHFYLYIPKGPDSWKKHTFDPGPWIGMRG